MIIDRLVASTAAMAATLYFMASVVAWYRWFKPKPTTMPHVRSVILDRALAWSSLAIIFYTIVAIKMRWYHWSDDYIDVVRIVALSIIFVCGLISIRAMSIRHFGFTAVGWFGAISFVAGLLMLLL